jgi:hypothetical protein
MNLADFETVCDVLEHPIQILHYFMRREAIEGTVDYIADELDLVGLYLTTLLNLGDVESSTSIIMTGASAPLDKYYASLDVGVTLEKPKPRIAPLFASIFAQLEQRRVKRWTEIGVALNMFSPDDQAKIARLAVRLEKKVAKEWQIEGHKNTIICTPPKNSAYAFCYVMFKNENASRRHEFMENAAANAFQSKHVETAVVVGKNIDRDDASYHAIAMFEPPPESTDQKPPAPQS